MKTKILFIFLGIFIFTGIFGFVSTSEVLINTNSSVNHAPMFINNTLVIPNFVEVNKPYVFKAPVYDPDADSITINWFLDSDLVSTIDEYIFTGVSKDIYNFRNISVIVSDGKLSKSLNFSVFVSPQATLGGRRGGGGKIPKVKS